VGTIVDNDSATLSVGDRTLTEGQTGSMDGFAFTVTLSNPVDVPVMVTIGTSDGTATVANNDYEAVTGSPLTFSPGGPLTQSFSVDVIGDTVVEPDETFNVNLSNVQVASGRDVSIAVDGAGLGTITNDDQAQAGALVQSMDASAETSTTLRATRDSSDALDAAFSGWDDSTGALDEAIGATDSWLP
jgi:hypothetical protein